jgi:toxin ParE1/3/4
MKTYNVMLLEPASKDLKAILRYLNHAVGNRIALKEIEALEAACDSLAENPECGSVPHELEKIRAFEYHQIISKSYRIIYQIIEDNVFVFAIIHGRRNIQDILRQRLFIR